METNKELETQREVYDLFRISILIKGAISFLEIIGGILFLLIPPTVITGFVVFLTQDELSENPDSFFASHAMHAVSQYTGHTASIIAFYLLSRGIVKFGLVIALLKDKIWAYPASLAVLGLFVFYQIIEFILHDSIIVLGLTLFDLIVIYFIWREYLIVRKRRKTRG